MTGESEYITREYLGTGSTFVRIKDYGHGVLVTFNGPMTRKLAIERTLTKNVPASEILWSRGEHRAITYALASEPRGLWPGLVKAAGGGGRATRRKPARRRRRTRMVNW